MNYNQSVDLVTKLALTTEAVAFDYFITEPEGSNFIRSFYEDFFKKLECFIDLKFSLTPENSSFEISICGITEHQLEKNEGVSAYATLGYTETNVTEQCLITIDNNHIKSNLNPIKSKSVPTELRGAIESSSIQSLKNTLAHEFLHCLVLDHPVYPKNHALSYNKQYRSVMEDNSPIIQKCSKLSPKELAQAGFHSTYQCIDSQIFPTNLDMQVLIELYGKSTLQNDFCQHTRQEFIGEHGNDILSKHFDL